MLLLPDASRDATQRAALLREAVRAYWWAAPSSDERTKLDRALAGITSTLPRLVRELGKTADAYVLAGEVLDVTTAPRAAGALLADASVTHAALLVAGLPVHQRDNGYDAVIGNWIASLPPDGFDSVAAILDDTDCSTAHQLSRGGGELALVIERLGNALLCMLHRQLIYALCDSESVRVRATLARAESVDAAALHRLRTDPHPDVVSALLRRDDLAPQTANGLLVHLLGVPMPDDAAPEAGVSLVERVAEHDVRRCVTSYPLSVDTIAALTRSGRRWLVRDAFSQLGDTDALATLGADYQPEALASPALSSGQLRRWIAALPAAAGAADTATLDAWVRAAAASNRLDAEGQRLLAQHAPQTAGPILAQRLDLDDEAVARLVACPDATTVSMLLRCDWLGAAELSSLAGAESWQVRALAAAAARLAQPVRRSLYFNDPSRAVRRAAATRITSDDVALAPFAAPATSDEPAQPVASTAPNRPALLAVPPATPAAGTRDDEAVIVDLHAAADSTAPHSFSSVSPRPAAPTRPLV
jgi:hypothetical protein